MMSHGEYNLIITRKAPRETQSCMLGQDHLLMKPPVVAAPCILAVYSDTIPGSGLKIIHMHSLLSIP